MTRRCGGLRWTVVGVAMLLGGCQAASLPVPVRGTLEPLVGEWVGEYSSPETGRGGSIVFKLEAGRDTAYGDVLMIPANIDLPSTARSTDPTGRPPRVLQISFVRCEGNAVTGWLDPYPDPDTGESTATTFDGTIKGDRLEGTFVSFLERSGTRRTGKWTVTRKVTP